MTESSLFGSDSNVDTHLSVTALAAFCQVAQHTCAHSSPLNEPSLLMRLCYDIRYVPSFLWFLQIDLPNIHLRLKHPRCWLSFLVLKSLPQ